MSENDLHRLAAEHPIIADALEFAKEGHLVFCERRAMELLSGDDVAHIIRPKRRNRIQKKRTRRVMRQLKQFEEYS